MFLINYIHFLIFFFGIYIFIILIYMANNIELLSNTENFTIGTNSNLREILANVVRIGTDTSNVTISIPQDISSSYNLILPAHQGASGKSLVYGADGQLKWDDPTVLKQVVTVFGSNLGSSKVDSGEMTSVLFPTNYEASITPLSANTKIFVQFKVNYKAALSSDNQIDFYIYKNDTNGNTLAIFSETMYGPYIASGGFVGQYISNLIDEPNTTDEISYKLGYKIDGIVDVSDSLGILGYDASYNNTIVLQEFEGSGVYATSVWNKGSDSNGLYYNEGTVHIGSSKNAFGSQNTPDVALELSGILVGTNATFSGNVTVDGTLNSDDITGSNVTVSNDLVVSGNLTVNGNLVGNVTGIQSSLSNLTTDELSEGSTNKYFSTSLVDSHLEGGTGVSYNNGSISIGQSVGTNDNVRFNNVTVDGTLNSDDITGSNVTVSNDLVVSGNLTVNGTRTIVNATTLDIGDNKIVVNAAGSTTDAGIIANVSGTEHEFIYSTNNNAWGTTGDLNIGGNVTGTTFIGDGSQLTGITDTNTTYTAGTGLSLDGTTFNNTAPDQTVTLTGSGATTVTGTYPNFTITSTDTNTDTNTTYTAGSNMSLVGTEFNIPQSVGTSDNVQFNQVTASSFIGDGSQLTGITDTTYSAGTTLPNGANYSNIIHWDSTSSEWVVNGSSSVRIGNDAGLNSSSHFQNIAIGEQAGYNSQRQKAVAIGFNAGQNTQFLYAVAIGHKTGQNMQGNHAVGIGDQVGKDNQGDSSIAIGYRAGRDNQGDSSIAIGIDAGENTQGTNAVAIGTSAGQNTQTQYSVAIGYRAAYDTQGNHSVAIGNQAGNNIQGQRSVAVGFNAAEVTQGQRSVAVGYNAGNNIQGSFAVAVGDRAAEATQGSYSIAIGNQAGRDTQGEHSIAIGYKAGSSYQSQNSIVLNASGSDFQATTQGFYAKPIRGIAHGIGVGIMKYDSSTGEITYSTT